MKYKRVHIGRLISEMVEEKRWSKKKFAELMGIARQNVDKTIFLREELMTDVIRKAAEILDKDLFAELAQKDPQNDYTATGTQGVAARHIEKLEQHSGEPTETQKQLTDTQARLIEAQQRIIDLLSSGKQDNTPEE